MFEAILFDLDGTLLDIDMDYFLPLYFEKMVLMGEKYGFDNMQEMVKQVFNSTSVMMADTNLRITNEEIFLQDFLDKCDHLTRDKTLEFFDHFYNDGFPKLSKYAKPFPGILEMMENLFKEERKIVIATNSVFPHTAIQQRLDWAGVGHFDYDLITSYEVMHACKPKFSYYEEIATIIGVDPKNCLMVGNDIGEDLVAGKIGMKTFLVEDRLIDKGIDIKPNFKGNLESLFRFMEQI
ncbi:MAG TPA: HAD family hydrolase [Syntrophomonadaceae bacterium]|nr:HAD family hydrolase [Syntrophomonadaceae bacterium]